jgi:hypothetical protein
MKKKAKEKKKQDMPEFEYKEFTAEESSIYEEAVKKFRGAVGAGQTLKQAYDGYAIADEKLRSLIQADFLKILIAERTLRDVNPWKRSQKTSTSRWNSSWTLMRVCCRRSVFLQPTSSARSMARWGPGRTINSSQIIVLWASLHSCMTK